MEPGTIIDAQHPPPPASQTDNQTPKAVKQGHRFLLVYLFVIIAAVLTGSVYAWQHHDVTSLRKQVKTLNSQVASLNSQVSTLSAPQPGVTNNNSPLDYKDWKTFCDSINNSCFRYPKDWTIDGSSNSSKAAQTLSSANATVSAQYNDPVKTPALDQVFYIADIHDLNKNNLGLKIVARVIGNTPDYVIVDGSYLVSNNIKAGKSLSFTDDARFTSLTTKTSAQLVAKPTGASLSNIKTPNQATAWFNSDDAKLCLKILRSFYYQ